MKPFPDSIHASTSQSGVPQRRPDAAFDGDCPGSRTAGSRTWVVLVGLSLLLSWSIADPAHAVEPRSQTLGIFQSIQSTYPASGLKAWVNDGRGEKLRIGDGLVYHFQSGRAGYLTVIHLDSHGVATLLYPTADASASHIASGESRSFPPKDAGFKLDAEPPLGREVVLVVATTEPITRDRLAAAAEASEIVVLEAGNAPAMAEALRRELASRDPGDVQVAMIEQTIEGRSEGSQYRSADIVDYFTTRTRSIRRPRLDFEIHFATASAELDKTAQANLDVAAEALSDSRMQGMKFVLGGHTDDVGTPDYNMHLSEERAESTRQYLVEKGIDPSRLEVQAYGETKPLEEGSDPEARHMNRRVDFTLVR